MLAILLRSSSESCVVVLWVFALRVVSFSDIVKLSIQSYPRIKKFMVYHVLRFLLDSPEFQLQTYAHRDSPLLQPPTPVHALPHGPKHVTRQLGLTSGTVEERKLALEQVLWCRSPSHRYFCTVANLVGEQLGGGGQGGSTGTGVDEGHRLTT